MTPAEHEIGERRDHFLAADLHAYALALGQANIIAPFLVEGRHKLIFRFALDVQTEDIARLDSLKILPALLAPHLRTYRLEQTLIRRFLSLLMQ